MALYLLPVLPIDYIIRFQHRIVRSREIGIHQERAVTNVDLEKLAGEKKKRQDGSQTCLPGSSIF